MNIGLAISLVGKLWAFSPSALLAGSTAFLWLDPSDLTTMFQDAAGTTPVTAPAQPVGRILDKSGNGFHATQSTAASRPTYGVVPSRGRVNLLTFTEQFDNAAWGKTANLSVTANFDTAPDGTNTADRFVSIGGPFPQTAQSVSGLVAGQSYTFSVWVKSDGTAQIAQSILLESGVTTFTPTSTWTRVSVTVASSAGGSRSAVIATNSGIAAASSFLIWGAQLELGSTATTYQRVVSQFNVTDPVGFPSYPLHYLFFDGVDDFLVTPTITPNADKVQVFAGVRKLSDANTAIVIEHSANYASNNGTLALFAPAVGTFPRYDFYTKGTSAAFAVTPSSYPAPITNVVTGLGDISGDIATLRVNGSLIQTVSSDQGTGNYLAYQMFIGRRNGTSLPFNGQLYGLITRFSTANLDASLISNTERWMGGKTGVTI